ncbi:uncharacterized protein LOC129188622 isoform X3 [Dunckerocampus dactyliophorus]|uniref:uncharacterized protein LOC129188622 isoform X3 n=1 Tax=Dunckerocampus dactyliophorus TaxID=161453 RepID=UPI002405DB48|nr:uncharacterized protein LOC129188622 isoform X3 [Dunckerocampus dactyliophorus]
MEMLLKQTTLVLLSVCVAATTQCTAVLNETRTRVVVPVDSALTLCYRMKSWTPKRFELYWHFNPSGPSFDNSERIFKSFILNMSNETKDTFQMYTLVNVTNNNSGWYFCRINADIPTLMSEDCNGTEVLVHVSLQDTWWLWVTVAVFGLIVLVLLVLCLLLTRQRKRREQSCPVYMNTHPSPRAPSTAQLRAPQSSQKLRTPSPARDNNNSKQRPKQQQRCHK